MVTKFKERATTRVAATEPPVTSYQLPITLFLIAAAISVVVSPDKRGALGIFKAYFVEPILIYLVIKDIVKSKKDWRLVFGALCFSGLWVALLAVVQGLTGCLIFTPHEAALGRAHGVYNTANALGLCLGPVVLLLLGAVKGVKGIKGIKKTAAIGGIGIMILAIVLSKSLGAMVGLVSGLVILGVFRILKGKLFVVHCLLLGLMILALVAGSWFFFNISTFTPKNVDPYVRETENTLQFRLCLWEGTRNMLLDRPVFGAGLSGFKELYSQKYFTCDAEPLEYPHSWVLNFWAETGLLGLAAFLWLLWRYFVKAARGPSATAYRLLPTAFLAAMIYWLVHGLVDVPYFKNDLALEFWAIVGLLETLKQEGVTERGSVTGC